MGKLARRSRGFGGLQIEGSFVVCVAHKIDAPRYLARLHYLRLEKTRSEQRLMHDGGFSIPTQVKWLDVRKRGHRNDSRCPRFLLVKSIEMC